jgi:hypothetical protein
LGLLLDLDADLEPAPAGFEFKPPDKLLDKLLEREFVLKPVRELTPLLMLLFWVAFELFVRGERGERAKLAEFSELRLKETWLDLVKEEAGLDWLVEFDEGLIELCSSLIWLNINVKKSIKILT